MSREKSVKELRAQLRSTNTRVEELLMSLAEAAQREAQLQSLLKRQRKENEDLQKNVNLQTAQMGGFQLELEARHYELPFLVAQLDTLLARENLPPDVLHGLRAMQETIKPLVQFTAEHKPTLDPVSWVVLARKLSAVFEIQKRIPAKRAERPAEVEA